MPSALFCRIPRPWIACLGLWLCATAQAAGDRRTVRQPELPTQVCATLAPPTDGQDSQPRIQEAIDRCPQGQAVRLTGHAAGGRFVSAPLAMKPGVTLWLDRGAVLAASTDPRAYDRGRGTCGTIDGEGTGCRPFILFERTRGGGIVGDGEIDGQGGQPIGTSGESWWQLARRAQAEHGRQNAPRLIEIDHASDLTLYRVRLTNSPNFHVAMNQVRGVTVWGVTIDAPADARNTDGIDPGAAEDVTIAHSFIRTGDDNVAIKAGRNGGSRHISILDNHFYAGHGMSIGSETLGGVEDVLVRGLTLDGTTYGLRIKSDASRGGEVRQVLYQDVCLRNNRWPIFFDTHYDRQARGDAIPTYRGIALQDVRGDAGLLVLRGYDEAHALDVALQDIRFSGTALWQIEHARLALPVDGVFPRPPGGTASATPASGPAGDCSARWVPFPVAASASVSGAAAPAATAQPPAAGPVIRVGPGQRYTRIQDAADAATAGDTLLIEPGLYPEVIHLRTPGLHVVGRDGDPGAVVIEGDRSAGDSGGTLRSATVSAEADGIELRGLTIANRFHDRHPGAQADAQAVALSATGDRQRFIHLHLIGHQDTLHAGSRGCSADGQCALARQYYEDDVIEGAVDFVFGDALAYFERTELKGTGRPQVTVTAQGRRFPGQRSGYVFHDCKVTGDAGVREISLGRPWRDQATVSYVDCWLDGRVSPEGFTEWHGEHRLETARYAELRSRGPGARPREREPHLVQPGPAEQAGLSSARTFLGLGD
ncbi:pectinesterase family protein [Acidovorax sp. NCPPB 2350]|nr:pectinesterase family protein [Acidovorax sp. NCPPB 2350]